MIWLVLFCAIVAVVYFTLSFRAEQKPKDKVRLYCGTMGSGKTYSAVNDCVGAYKAMRFKHKLRLLKDKPHFFSNIPVQLRKLSKSECKYLSNYCGRRIRNVDDVVSHYKDTGENLRPILERWGVLNEWITKDHLFLRAKLPQNSCVLLDELSLIADQYSHDIPEVREQLVFYIGFCRHWFLGHGGLLCCTAQATDSIVKQVRTKFGVCVLLNGFRRFALISPWYIVNCNLLINTDDVRIVDQTTRVDKKTRPYYFGYLGYKRRYYNSKCYSIAYDEKFSHIPDFAPQLCTRYIIDIQCSKNESKEYSANREKYRSILFDDASVRGSQNTDV